MPGLNPASRLHPVTPDACCAFCGMPGIPMMQDSALCTECLDHCNRSLVDMRRVTLRERLAKLPAPADLVAMLDRKVVGLSAAKRALAVAVYNHYKRVLLAEELPRDHVPGKANVLLAGPTGSGKTFLVEALAELLQVPYASVDAASLTAPGHAGKDVGDVALALLDDCGGDLRRARHGIVFIDNIDKLRARPGVAEDDLGGLGVQQALLCLLEGGELQIDSRRYGRVAFPTRHILFVAAGAFEAPASPVRGVGFVPESLSAPAAGRPDWLAAPGFLAELAGRFPLQLTLPAVDVAQLAELLTCPCSGLLAGYRTRFRLDGVRFEATPAAVDAIVQRAFRAGGGARALKRVLEQLLLNTLFHVPSLPSVDAVWLDAAGDEPVVCLQSPLAA